MQKDVRQMSTDELRDFLLSNTSVSALGCKAEEKLQHGPDYEHCKQQVFDNQKKIAFWDSMRTLSGLAGGMMSGMFAGTLGAAFNAPDFVDSISSNPVTLVAGGAAVGLSGVAIYSNYRNNLIWTQNNFIQNESGARKGAEMGKLHAVVGHEASLATTEYNAKRMGEEVEKAMERSFARHHARTHQDVPTLSVAEINSVTMHRSHAQGMAL